MPTDHVTITDAVTVSNEVTARPSDLGALVASWNSDNQAEFLQSLCRHMMDFGPLAWRMQCAYIREEYESNASVARSIAEILNELMPYDER